MCINLWGKQNKVHFSSFSLQHICFCCSVKSLSRNHSLITKCTWQPLRKALITFHHDDKSLLCVLEPNKSRTCLFQNVMRQFLQFFIHKIISRDVFTPFHMNKCALSQRVENTTDHHLNLYSNHGIFPVWIFQRTSQVRCSHLEAGSRLNEDCHCLVTCIVYHHCSFRCPIWFSTCWIARFL